MFGWYLKNSTPFAIKFSKLKKGSDYSAEWKGGTPKARMKKTTPRENMSVGYALHGIDDAK